MTYSTVGPYTFMHLTEKNSETVGTESQLHSARNHA